MSLSVDTAYVLCSRIASIWIIVSAAEGLSLLREFGPGGIYDPRVSTFGVGVNSVLHVLTNKTKLYTVFLVARLGAGLVLLLSPDTLVLMTIAWSIVAASMLVSGWRRKHGGDDGSDQMLNIMSVAFTVSLLLGFSNRVRESGLYFIGAQACLAYSTAGVAKLISQSWRSGLAIQGVLSTRTHGMQRLNMVIQKSSLLALVVCWGTIALETAFILAPVLPPMPLLALLAIAAFFHVGIALVMGLNGFLWSFVSTYPAIVFLNQSVTRLF
jgi:hypothetical protein